MKRISLCLMAFFIMAGIMGISAHGYSQTSLVKAHGITVPPQGQIRTHTPSTPLPTTGTTFPSTSHFWYYSHPSVSPSPSPTWTRAPAFPPTPTLLQQYCPCCSGKRVLLTIPDRDEDRNAPEEGWCGEVSIQMALAYFGKEVSQSVIHAAGNTAHADLWEDDIGVALDNLGANVTTWDRKNKDQDAFLAWVGKELRAGHPVILGTKFYPDETDWDTDHFVLAVGCDSGGLIINTNNAGDGQYFARYGELTGTAEDSYTLINPHGILYGWAIVGLKSTSLRPTPAPTPKRTPFRRPG